MPQTDILKSVEAVLKTTKYFELRNKIEENYKRKKNFVIAILFLTFPLLIFFAFVLVEISIQEHTLF